MAQRYFEGLAHASLYAKFRTSPSPAIINTVIEYLKHKYKGPLDQAIDVGCGSGQSTTLLAPHFTKVLGTDISSAQLQHAREVNPASNVCYLVSPAEHIPVPAKSTQLVTACQACHWFDLPKFFAEIDRVLVPSGVVALYGYLFPDLVHPDPVKVLGFRAAIDKIYSCYTAGYWGPGRLAVDNRYADIHIPYQDNVRKTAFYPTRTTTLADFKSFLTTWSGLQTFQQKHGEEKVAAILQEFQETVQDLLETQALPEDVSFNITNECFILMGRKPTENRLDTSILPVS